MLRLCRNRGLYIKNGAIWRMRYLADTYIGLCLPEVDVAIGRQGQHFVGLHFHHRAILARLVQMRGERFFSPKGLAITSANGVAKLYVSPSR